MFEEDQTENYSPLERLRHSAAHVMASAVKMLFPEAKLGIGPAIENGFYYDLALPRALNTEDLSAIEAKMREIIAQDLPFERIEASKAEALEYFRKQGEIFKVEIIENLPDGSITYYRHGDFVDLCRGPHVASTAEIKAIKLLSVAGAYWRGDAKQPMLQRIYGTAFASEEDLQKHLHLLQEAEARDHRKLGKDLDLFSSMENLGPGLILWHPKGARVRQVLEDFWRRLHREADYEPVYSPHLAKLDLWKTSGHVDFYGENMFAPMTMEGQEYQVKPMNCPFHIQIFEGHTRSYRELPIRFAELGTVYRFERSGVMHGLLRVRGFTQDDAHIFCRPDQIQSEVEAVLELTQRFLNAFGFYEFELYLSTRPEKSVGSDQNWELATSALRAALDARKIPYKLDPGEGVFYGPKIDLKIKDALGRLWQCSTIQVDFNNPERFKLEYIAPDGSRQIPIMIHRALMGSMERFFGILIEHFAGAFPAWLAPVQAVVLPIKSDHQDYALQVAAELKSQGFRVDANLSGEKLGHQIREAQLQKIPYMLVVGGKEAEAKSVAVRSRVAGDQGLMTVSAFAAQLKSETDALK